MLFSCRNTTFVPGFFKIFDEILVNAADNKVSVRCDDRAHETDQRFHHGCDQGYYRPRKEPDFGIEHGSGYPCGDAQEGGYNDPRIDFRKFVSRPGRD